MTSQSLSVPNPVRLLAGIAAVILVGGAIVGSSVIYTVREFLSHVGEKDYIQKALADMSLGEGLPADLKPTMALRFPTPASIVFLERPAEKQQLVLLSYEMAKDVDPREEIDRFYDLGINYMGVDTTNTQARFNAIKKQDKVDLDGHGRTVNYLIGTLLDSRGNTYAGALACLVHGKKVLMLQFLQPSDRPFSLDPVLDILRKASSF